MSVYKEAMSWTSEINKLQKRLWKDACDYGVPVTDEDNDEALQLVKNLKDLYGHNAKRVVKRHPSGTFVKLHLTFLDEFGDGSEVPCTITYQRLPQPQSCDATEEKIVGILQIDCDKWLNSYGTMPEKYYA